MSRILFVSTMAAFPWGGSEELWSRAAALLSAKHEVACSVHHWPELHPRLQSLQSCGVKIMPRKPTQSKAIRVFNWFLPDSLQRKATPSIEQALASFKPDLVVVNQGGNTDGLQSMLACQKRGIPFVNLIHAVPEGVFWPDDAAIRQQRPLYQSSRRLYFISERNREFFETQFVARFANGVVIRNPVNVSYGTSLPWPSPEAPLRLACVSRIEFYAKGQDLLVDIFAQPKWRERAVTLDFYGSGTNQQILEKRIHALGLNNLAVRGFVQDVPSIWATHHALVLASRQEGLPLALVEAFLCSRPAVVTRVGGNAELVTEGRNGFVAAAPTAALLDQALERMWQQRANLSAMGTNARRTVEKSVPPDAVEIFVKDLAQLLPVQT
jgi:glycosyltransferase involved in cell wall biosynthesis